MAEITVFPARTVRTMEPSLPVAEAVAVRDGRIVEVGTIETMRPWLESHIHEVDDTFKDLCIMPGFIDPHLHPSMAALLLNMHFTTAVGWDLPGEEIEPVRDEKQFRTRLDRPQRGSDAPGTPP